MARNDRQKQDDVKNERGIAGDKARAFETVTAFFRQTGKTGGDSVVNSGTRRNVTPPEYMILLYIHKKQNVGIVEMTGPAVDYNADRSGKRYRTNDSEADRLRDWYGVKIFEELFSRIPMLPRTFAEIGFDLGRGSNVSTLKRETSAQEQAAELAGIMNTLSRDDAGDDGMDGGRGDMGQGGAA